MLTDLDKPIDKLDDLNDEEREALREWSDFFTGKYMIVGSLIEEVETKLGNAI